MIYIVVSCCVTIYSLFHDCLHTVHQLLVCQAFVKTTRKSLSIIFLETFHVLAVSHHFNSLHYLSFIVSDEFKSKEEKMLEMKKYVWLCSFHKFHIIFGEFERCFLKIEISWRAADDKAKIDMNNVTKVINKNIIVMSIFNLKQILYNWISS